MGIRVKSTDGKATGYIDVASELQRQVPGASITDFDKDTGELSFKAGDKHGRINIKREVAARGAEIVGVEDLNAPEQAVDSSPLTWRERWELGFLTRESSDFQRLTGAVSEMFGGKPTTDAEIAANEKRALGQLKKRYDDAKVVGGEMVVKQNGVWKKVDSSSDSIGEDAAQILGNTGLNAMASIAMGAWGATAGSALGPAGTVIGGVGGAVAGALLGEVAEEATAVGIVGGEVDVGGAARDIMTEGVLAMVGEGIAGGATKLAAKFSKVGPEAAARLAQAETIKTEATVVKGMSKFAEAADGKVKDMVAKTYSTLNPELSEAPLREAIDSPINMATAAKWSKVSRNVGRNGYNPLPVDMADEIQKTADGALDAVEGEFGAVLKNVRSKLTDDFSIDLEQHAIDLNAAATDSLKGAPKHKRAFFDVLENETKELITKRGSGDKKLYGAEAFDFVQRQYELISNSLKSSGAYNKQDMIQDDRLLFNAMDKIKSYINDKRIYAANTTGLSPQFEAIKVKYGNVKDALDTLWSKSFSNKRDLTFAQNLAKGKVDDNILNALYGTNEKRPGLAMLLPNAGIDKMTQSIRLKQAGMEMTPMLKMQSLTSVPGAIHGAGVTGATVAGGIPGAVAAATTVSPRFAAAQAHTVAKASGLTKKALSAAMPAARAKARSLMGMAYSAGFIRTLSHAQTRALIQNPEMFEQWLNQASTLSSSLEKASPEAVTEAAIKASQGAK